MTENFNYTVKNRTLYIETETQGLQLYSNSKHSDVSVKVLWLSDEEAYILCPESPEEDFNRAESHNESTRAIVIPEENLRDLVDKLAELKKTVEP